MPAIFFLSLPATGESSAGAEPTTRSAHDDDLGYSGHLFFDGSFDQYGFMPRRAYAVDGGIAVDPAARAEWEALASRR